MAGLTTVEAVATLDARFPITGGTDHIAYSIDGTSEWTGLARTPVGATGWAAATSADPAVKANGAALTTAAATAAGTVTHFAVFSALSAGTQRTDWQALTASKPVAVGDQLQWAVGALQVTLT
jgi:hypothetical protein